MVSTKKCVVRTEKTMKNDKSHTIVKRVVFYRLKYRFCTILYLPAGPGASGCTGVRVEGGQGVCGREGGGGGLIY
eukprot:COSAG01_NODE_25_length_37050_cov_211.559119_22_plen_75_part_00